MLIPLACPFIKIIHGVSVTKAVHQSNHAKIVNLYYFRHIIHKGAVEMKEKHPPTIRNARTKDHLFCLLEFKLNYLHCCFYKCKYV